MRKNTNPLFQLLKHVISANIFAKQTNKLWRYLINGSSKYFFENKPNPLLIWVDFFEIVFLIRDLSQAENNCFYKLSNWQNDNYFHSRWPFWVKQMSFCAFAQLVTTFIIFSAGNKSRVKWDKSQNSTQKIRTLIVNNFLEFSKLQCHSVLFHNSIAFVSYFFKFMIVELNQNTFEICWLLCQCQKKKLKKNIFSIVKVFT